MGSRVRLTGYKSCPYLLDVTSGLVTKLLQVSVFPICKMGITAFIHTLML